MKNSTHRKRLSIATLLATIISFPLKIFGQGVDKVEEAWFGGYVGDRWPMYWLTYTPNLPTSESSTIISTILRIIPWLLVTVTFIIWIVNFIKVRKIDDKWAKNKKIKKTIVAISILTIIFVALLIFTPSLIKFFS